MTEAPPEWFVWLVKSPNGGDDAVVFGSGDRTAVEHWLSMCPVELKVECVRYVPDTYLFDDGPLRMALGRIDELEAELAVARAGIPRAP